MTRSMANTAMRLARAVGQKPRILVVDDNRDFAENIAELLSDLGFQPEVSLTGKQALDLFVQKPFEVAIVDIQLPDMTGTRVIARFKEIHPDCACIVFTGNATLANAIDSLNWGAFAYLVKGCEVDEFRAILSKALGAYEAAAELKQIRGINQAIMGNFPGLMLIVDAGDQIILTNGYPLTAAQEGAEGGGSAPQRLEEVFRSETGWGAQVLEYYRSHRDSPQATVLRRLRVEQGEEVRHLNVHFVPLLKSIARWLILTDDITELVRMEHEIERTARLAAMGELAATISHEVRNPLSGISGAIQVLQRKFSAERPEWEICDQIIGQVERLNQTIEDLLVLARPMSAKVVETDVADLIESTLSLLREDANFRNVRFQVKLDRPRESGLLDPFLFRQALVNVLLNAAQAMGGQGEITVSVSGGADRVQVKVQDQGPGFPADPARLFEPFFTTKPAGTGLGLPITAKVLEVHGGSISLRNHERGGAEVTMTLPRGRPDL